MQLGERHMAIAYDGNTDTISEGSTMVTITKNGAGDYSIALTDPGQRACHCELTMREADRQAHYESETKLGLDVLSTDLAATPADAKMLIKIIAYDSADQI